jgi:predicted  nucleic acid-binding Zn ribbon protein
MGDDIYERLRPPLPTPSDEICRCSGQAPIKLMSTAGIGGFNPIHCLGCNLEVSPKRLGLTTDLIDAVAFWRSTYGAIDLLELNSGEYEAWAQAQLLDPSSAANVEGRAVSRDLNDVRRCYYWLWQPESHEGWTPRLTCPVCGDRLARYAAGVFPQLLCERDRLVCVGR